MRQLKKQQEKRQVSWRTTQRLLMQKYRFKKHEADMLADFLLPMLRWSPSDRPSAQAMLEHPWLSMPDDYSYRMSDLEFQKFTLKQ